MQSPPLCAKELAKQMNVAEFVGGPSWCCRFMRRNRLSVRARTTVGQKLTDGWEEKVVNFREFVSRRKEELGIQADRIFNMDEVPMSFDRENEEGNICGSLRLGSSSMEGSENNVNHKWFQEGRHYGLC